MRTLFIATAASLVLCTIGSVAIADQLPRSGTISVHTGWKAIGEMLQVTEDRIQGTGSIWGVSFNDRGSGPLHMGPTVCSYAYIGIKGEGTVKGECYFSDPDGDKIFGSFSGAFGANGQSSGVNELTGGTGKYAGIRGKGPYKCQWLSDKGHLACTEQFEYRLP
jgi:hypothetical protein